MKKMKNILVVAIIGIILAVAVVYVYSCLANHACPYCHGKLSFQTEIVRDGTTKFRYVCEDSPLHIVDSPIKY